MPYPAQTDQAAIVAAARVLIEQGGAEALTLGQVAATLGIKAPSLYRHVAGKAALLQAVHTQTFRLLFDAYTLAASAATTPAAQLRAIAHTHRAFARAHPQTYARAFSAADPAEQPDAQLLLELALPIEALVAALVGPARALPALRGLLALLHGFAMLEIHNQLQRGGDLDAAYDEAVAAYLTGLQRGGDDA